MLLPACFNLNGCIVLGRNENIDQLDEQTIVSIKNTERRRIEKVVDRERENVSIFILPNLIRNLLNSVFDFQLTKLILKSYLFVGAPKRILSSPREKIQYSFEFPNTLKSIIQESKGDIVISEVRSKKFFEFCSKFIK